MKLSIFIVSDPRGGDEALGRAFNALATAAESMDAGDDVELVFAGAGTRWPAEMTKLTSPLRKLYDTVRPITVGVSCGCAEVFGAKAEAEACGLPLVEDRRMGQGSGIAGFRNRLAQGRTVLVF